MNTAQFNKLLSTDPAALAAAVDITNKLSAGWNVAAPVLCRIIEDRKVRGTLSTMSAAELLNIADPLISATAAGLVEGLRMRSGAVNGSYLLQLGAPYTTKKVRGRTMPVWVTVGGCVYADPTQDNSGRDITDPAALVLLPTDYSVDQVVAKQAEIADLTRQIADLEARRNAARDLVGAVCSHLEY